VCNYLRKKNTDVYIREARDIYDAQNRKKALKAYTKWSGKWRLVSPKAVNCIEKDLEELLAFYACPQELYKRLRTTNVFERAFREVRRRTRPISCFNNTEYREDRLCGAESS
jgi:transposase-like protein